MPGPRAIPPDNTQFGEVELSKRLQRVIPSYGYWNMQFLTTEKAYVKFNFTIPRGSSIGFYARRNALPTHTQYDFKEILSGFNTRTARAAYQPLIHRDVTRFMEAGFWFISLYNDDGHNQEVTFYASIAGEMMRNCPNGCNGNGNCISGHCQCNAGFGGDSCNESKFMAFITAETSLTFLLRCLSRLVQSTRRLYKRRMSMQPRMERQRMSTDSQRMRSS